MSRKKVSDGRVCETTKKIEHERKGCLAVPTGKGSDFLSICPDKKPTYVEVKKGCGSLTPFQKKTRDEVRKSGYEYKIERCSCPKKTKS